MSQIQNELRANNTSGVPSLRLRTRETRTGLPRRWIDVMWWRHGRRSGTSIPVGAKPIEAVTRAMQRRAEATGTAYNITPRHAWNLLNRQPGA